MKRAHVIISGDVQGVGYRLWCKAIAQRLGLIGWVRNREDGTVEAVFEGDEKDVKEMIDFCRKGPEICWVSDVKVIWKNVKGEEGFEIKH